MDFLLKNFVPLFVGSIFAIMAFLWIFLSSPEAEKNNNEPQADTLFSMMLQGAITIAAIIGGVILFSLHLG